MLHAPAISIITLHHNWSLLLHDHVCKMAFWTEVQPRRTVFFTIWVYWLQGGKLSAHSGLLLLWHHLPQPRVAVMGPHCPFNLQRSIRYGHVPRLGKHPLPIHPYRLKLLIRWCQGGWDLIKLIFRCTHRCIRSMFYIHRLTLSNLGCRFIAQTCRTLGTWQSALRLHSA